MRQEQGKAKLVTPDQEEKPQANSHVLPASPTGKPSRRARHEEEMFAESSPILEQVRRVHGEERGRELTPGFHRIYQLPSQLSG